MKNFDIKIINIRDRKIYVMDLNCLISYEQFENTIFNIVCQEGRIYINSVNSMIFNLEFKIGDKKIDILHLYSYIDKNFSVKEIYDYYR
jgi:hypothetical protein